jgi:hypothetical protein
MLPPRHRLPLLLTRQPSPCFRSHLAPQTTGNTLASDAYNVTDAELSIEAESVLLCDENDEVFEEGSVESRCGLPVIYGATCDFGVRPIL